MHYPIVCINETDTTICLDISCYTRIYERMSRVLCPNNAINYNNISLTLTKCDCRVDWLWARSPLEKMKYLFIFSFLRLVSGQSAALSSATQHAMPPEFSGKWGTEVLNTMIPLPTQPCGGYSVKLIYLIYFYKFSDYATNFKQN